MDDDSHLNSVPIIKIRTSFYFGDP